jgi:hypothetical protein
MQSQYGQVPRLFLIASVFLVFFEVGCSSAPSTTKTPTINTEAPVAEVLSLRQWLIDQSNAARSINLGGNISVDQNGSSQSASFELKSKRLNVAADRRVDSLSVIVSGPFGITVARFLAAPEKYAFYDILHGETMSGKTDNESLEQLTQLRGVSLPMMSDLVFGLLPGASDILPEDSIVLYQRSTIQTMIIYRMHDQVTDMAELAGSMPEAGAPIAPAALALRRFRRWNGFVNDPINTQRPADVSIQFSDHTMENGLLIPRRIEANAGKNSLELEYTDVQVNPAALTVKIKMP